MSDGPLPEQGVGTNLELEGRPGDALSPSPPRQPPNDSRVEEAYTRIIDLVASIRNHLEQQDRRAERMGPTIEALAEGLGKIPEAANTQVELLAEIERRLQHDAERAKRTEVALAQLPHVADAQRETMVSMGRQLETLNEANERGAVAFQEFRQVLSQLTDATHASTSFLKQIQVDSAAREDHMARLMMEQTKRFTLFALAVIILAAVAAAAGVFALVR